MSDKVQQAKVQRKKLAQSSSLESPPKKGEHVKMVCDELVAKLEDVDMLIREEIKREIGSNNHNNHASSRLACLMRSRADVQSAITCLLGASH